MTAATPTVQIDNEQVRVTEWRFAPGEETGWHTHTMDYVVVPLYDGVLRIESNDGTVDVPLRHGQSYARTAGVEHNVINPGSTEFAFVEVELKAASRRLDTFVWPVI
ncbi:MAG TPA: cupin domain-containing protein [Ilumatobacteraceae bacterium]|nr:cupin domain-containing protein [Ilumatobacteraceae bacterium]